MAKYLEWYLVELEKKLEGKVGPEAAFELLNQTEDHLAMIKEELMLAGMDELTSERVAIQRFGDQEVLAGKSPSKPIVRASWAAPALILIGGTVLTGASMFVGSNDSMMIAGGLGIASLVVSALLCCRRGRLPSLAFGILLATCFTSLAVIASIEFYGPKLDLVRRTDRTKFAAVLEVERARTEAGIAVERAGLAWARAGEDAPVPKALKSASGIAVPVLGNHGQIEFSFDGTVWWRTDGLGHLFGIGGHRFYDARSAILLTARTRRISTARERWASLRNTSYSLVDPEFQAAQYEAATAALASDSRWDSDNLFAGIACGAAISTLWMLIATFLNWLANVDLSGRTQRRMAPARVRGIA